MTDKQKKILLQELCCRLPYGVKAQCDNCLTPFIITDIDITNDCIIVEHKTDNIVDGMGNFPIEEVKPYLRPLDTITQEEFEEWQALMRRSLESQQSLVGDFFGVPQFDGVCLSSIEHAKYLYRKHFDVPHWVESEKKYMTMIETGLAIEAPKGIYDNN